MAAVALRFNVTAQIVVELVKHFREEERGWVA